MPRAWCPDSWSRCATPAAHNFVGGPIDGYEKPICFLTRPAAAALAKVARDLEPRGLTIKVFDCYRPERAVAHFIRWARDLARRDDEGRILSRASTSATLFRDGYIAARSGHSRGSTVDLTLARRGGGAGARHGHAVRFLQPALVAVGQAASARRRRPIARCWRRRCARRGFRPYDKEWWHFTLRDEPYPQTLFRFSGA